jgi:hypothetical protein
MWHGYGPGWSHTHGSTPNQGGVPLAAVLKPITKFTHSPTQPHEGVFPGVESQECKGERVIPSNAKL